MVAASVLHRLRQRAGPANTGRPSPDRLARRIAALYRSWTRPGFDLREVIDGYLAEIALPDTSLLKTVARRLAADLKQWEGHPYHSSLHHAEVANNAMVLAWLSAERGKALAPADVLLLLVAALGHDRDHDGTTNGDTPFRLETIAANAVDEICRAAGVDADARADLRLLILSTDATVRPKLHALRDSVDPGSVDLPPALDVLRRSHRLFRLARLLSDADLMSSAALTKRWSLEQSARLSAEWRKPIDHACLSYFFDGMVGQDMLSKAGRFFSGNLRKIRAAALERADR